MPLTEKGKEIMKSMQKQYGKKKAEKIFYASKNAGKITGVEKTMKAKKGKMIKAVAGILTGPISYKMAKKKKMKMEDLAPIFGAAGLAYSQLNKRKSGSPKKGENKKFKDNPEDRFGKYRVQEAKSGKMMKLKGGGAAIRGINFKGTF